MNIHERIDWLRVIGVVGFTVLLWFGAVMFVLALGGG